MMILWESPECKIWTISLLHTSNESVFPNKVFCKPSTGNSSFFCFIRVSAAVICWSCSHSPLARALLSFVVSAKAPILPHLSSGSESSSLIHKSHCFLASFFGIFGSYIQQLPSFFLLWKEYSLCSLHFCMTILTYDDNVIMLSGCQTLLGQCSDPNPCHSVPFAFEDTYSVTRQDK